ncbi:MAG: rRNA pseudouridine synthase [Deltaproteobacteria bacterium]|jgi:23S rRNA pseudouridine2605 synthase/23S rRNA pseudouridine2604 synthase|nr:rRNA pseudouridine synthase [Deltaproteobacteria bacterium]
MPLVRLQKYLSAAGVCSRRKGEDLIVAGKVAVNGEVIVELGTKIDPDQDRVEVDGKAIKPSNTLVYIALNKPKDYVTSCSHPGQKVVVDLVDISERIYPVGRLDKDSTGLLLLTNDGRIHHRLSHPSFDHEKEYDVTVARPIPDGALKKMSDGLPLMGTKTRPARITRISPRRFRMVLQEGKNRQIRRMVRKVGNEVTRLQRKRFASIKLGNLPPGKWRYLKESEKKSLLS